MPEWPVAYKWLTPIWNLASQWVSVGMAGIISTFIISILLPLVTGGIGGALVTW
jgi:hypothetical protein